MGLFSKTPSETPKPVSIGRNDPCYCGSGKKYKKCCEEKDEAKERAALDKKWAEAEKTAAQEKEKTEEAKTSEKPGFVPGKTQPTKAVPQKHTTFATPKYNMPRKSGGG